MKKNWLFHNSYSKLFRSPFGAVSCNKKINIKLKVRVDNVDGIFLWLFKDNGQQEKIELNLLDIKRGGKIYGKEICTPSFPGLLWYYFMVIFNGKTYYYGNNPTQTGGIGQITDKVPPAYQITVYKEDLSTPNWFKESIIYQIFPDRFYNGHDIVLNPKKNSLIHAHWDNEPIYIRDETGRVVRWDFFGGNLEGIRKKLPYLKSLGINIIYLNPIFESPSNHRYDTGDYHKIDPMLGDNRLFRDLCAEAKEMGISIILDGVFSHTGSDSIYFNKEGNYDSLGAYQSMESPYYRWYRFIDFPDQYESWWGIDTLPNVNELEPSYQDFIIFDRNSVVKYWLRNGIKGWRLDVVDELPGGFIKNLRSVMKEYDSSSILVGEVWEDASNKVSYGERREYLLGDELDSTMNYPFRLALLDFVLGRRDARAVHKSLMSLYENYPKHHFYSAMNLIGSHDVPRVLTVMEEEMPRGISNEQREHIKIARLKLVTLWQMTFPGVPSIYYGDEAGVEGPRDPGNRRTYPWGKENNEIMEWYKTLLALRNHYDVLRTGKWQPLYAKHGLYCFLRIINDKTDVFGQSKKDNVAVILMNRDLEKTITISLDLSRWCREKLVDVLEDYKVIALKGGRLKISLKPLEGKILLQDRWGDNFQENRQSGVLLHPVSLPSRYGIGDLGKGAYEFVDFLKRSGQKLWQILPLNPPGFGESPYQCFSAFAGNPLLIDIEELREEGLLSAQDLNLIPDFSINMVEYEKVKQYKVQLFKKAFNNFKKYGLNKDYHNFCHSNKSWLEDYALFASLKEYFNGATWNNWGKAIAFREESALKHYQKILAENIEYHRFLQYKFFTQWHKLKKYAANNGIKIIGDLPIFVAHDSSDVWTNPELFELDDRGYSTKVAGVPPDYFSETGQLWGNPLYKWDKMEEDGYRWWQERIKILSQQFDLIRIDHFLGFEAYWEIPAEEETAVNGRWVKGPGEKFFSAIKKELGEVPFIAEDLGHITPEVIELKNRFSFPGMKVMQFCMENKPGAKFSLPLYEKNTVVYTGTHDNDTILGWYRKYNESDDSSPEDICWHYIEEAMRSDARMVIIPLQDILCLDNDARMNVPGTVGDNWQWRFPEGCISKETELKLADLTKRMNR